MKKDLYTEFNDYFDYEEFSVLEKKEDMSELLKIIRRMEFILQVLAYSVIGILIVLLIK